MENTMKRDLLVYLLVSAVSFSAFVLTGNAGVSVLIFIIIQFVCMYYLVPTKKPLLMFIPISILGLNAFISANNIWHVPNFFVAVVLFSVMALWLTNQFSVKGALHKFVYETLKNIIQPLLHFALPVKWCIERQKAHMQTAKRVAIGVGFAVPSLIFISIVLASADAVFSFALSNLFWRILDFMRFDIIWKALFGLVVGFYLFGLLYYVKGTDIGGVKPCEQKTRNGDLIILNIVLASVLIIYTMFVIIQFRYLFAGVDNLPYGLTFESYARRGFFELMFLTAANIAFILIMVWLTKEQAGSGAKLTKILCFYLCAVTAILLISSFYRMWLHGSDDGLTRMRFLVFGFLIFKAVGLFATFAYVIKPKFNIIAFYCTVALTYYLVLNLVPMDAIVARSQIDRYFNTGHGGIDYVLTLSPDAGTQISRLLESENSATRDRVHLHFLYENVRLQEQSGWRQWNLSIGRFTRLP